MALAAASSIASRRVHAGDEGRPLSLAEAVERTLKTNKSFIVIRQDYAIASAQLELEEAIFIPRFVGDLRFSYDHSPARPITFEERDKRVEGILAVEGRALTGLSYRLEWNNLYERLDAPVRTFYEPFQSTAFRLTLTQPLLRNAWPDYTRAQIRIATARQVNSERLVRAQLERIVADVEIAYWGLVLARHELEIRREAVRLADQQVVESKKQLKLGAVAQIDVAEAEAEVGRNQERIPLSAMAIAQAEGQLLSLIQPEVDTASILSEWLPTTEPDLGPAPTRIDAYLETAERERPDLAAVRADLQAAEVAAEVARNRLRPQVDLVGTLALTGASGHLASNYATQGLDMLTPPFKPDPSLEGGPLDAFKNLRYPTGMVGLHVDVPFDNQQAHADLKGREADVTKRGAQIEALKVQIRYEVVTAYKELLADIDRVKATAETVALAERLLEGQRKRFKEGAGVSFDVVRAQSAVIRARIAQLRARVRGRISQARLALAQGVYLRDNHIEVQQP